MGVCGREIGGGRFFIVIAVVVIIVVVYMGCFGSRFVCYSIGDRIFSFFLHYFHFLFSSANI